MAFEFLKNITQDTSVEEQTTQVIPDMEKPHLHAETTDVAASNNEAFEGIEKAIDDFVECQPDIDETVVSNRIFTVANIVSIIRLCMIPVFMVLLFDGHNYLATFVFALAAGTDFVDGYIARSTSTVSKLGRVLDPAVDRLLMVFGVIGLFAVGRLPFWIIAVVLIRDATLLGGGFYFMARYKVRPKVVFAGKIVTTLLFIGFGFLLLNWPTVNGLGITHYHWLPGLNSDPCAAGIFFVYAGLVVGLCTTIYYVVTTLMQVGAVKAERAREQEMYLAQEDTSVSVQELSEGNEDVSSEHELPEDPKDAALNKLPEDFNDATRAEHEIAADFEGASACEQEEYAAK